MSQRVPPVILREDGVRVSNEQARIPLRTLIKPRVLLGQTMWRATVAEGRRIGAMLLDRDQPRRPDGIFAANDPLAMGILQAFGVDGAVAIPEDIAIIGYDDSDFDQSAFVPLSSIRTPHVAIGAAAVRLLLEPPTTPAEDDALHLVFKPELVARASTGSFPRTDASPAALIDRRLFRDSDA